MIDQNMDVDSQSTHRPQLDATVRKTAKSNQNKSFRLFLLGAVGVLAVLMVGLIVTLSINQRSTDDRSQADGGGNTGDYIFVAKNGSTGASAASVVLPAQSNPTTPVPPVSDILVRTSAGRPLVSYSFVAQLLDANDSPLTGEIATEAWSRLVFTPNAKVATSSAKSGRIDNVIPGAMLFAGSVANPLTETFDGNNLGSFKFTPVLNQPDVKIVLSPVTERPEANALFQVGVGKGEGRIPSDRLIGFTIRNPYYIASGAVATPTLNPEIDDVGPVIVRVKVTGNEAEWIDNPTAEHISGMIANAANSSKPPMIRAELRKTNVDQKWWNDKLSAGFRVRVKDPNGSFRRVILGNGSATNDTELVQWKPDGNASTANSILFTRWALVKIDGLFFVQIPTLLSTGAPNPASPGSKLPVFPGDTVEIRANIHSENFGNLNSVSRTCKVDGSHPSGTLIEAPIGNPYDQVVLGPCVNNSSKSMTIPTASASANIPN